MSDEIENPLITISAGLATSKVQSMTSAIFIVEEMIQKVQEAQGKLRAIPVTENGEKKEEVVEVFKSLDDRMKSWNPSNAIRELFKHLSNTLGRANEFSHSLSVESSLVCNKIDLPKGGGEDGLDVSDSYKTDLLKIIILHCLRTGQEEIARSLILEASLSSEFPEEDIHKYQLLRKLLESFDARDYSVLFSWANEQQTHSLTNHHAQARISDFIFSLHRLRFRELSSIASLQPKAIEYAKQNFEPFRETRAIEIQQLMGSVFFPNNNNTSASAISGSDETLENQNHDDVDFNNTRVLFQDLFCTLNHINPNSLLDKVASSTDSTFPLLLRYYEMSNNLADSQTKEFSSLVELPFEVNLSSTIVSSETKMPGGGIGNLHSIFVCPISREQSDEGNCPVLLVCGHVIAKKSMQQISRGRLRFKCPTCPVESSPNDVLELSY